jgi:endogenous inhibitor of DNA gyrase (YacG/DUF329 family)
VNIQQRLWFQSLRLCKFVDRHSAGQTYCRGRLARSAQIQKTRGQYYCPTSTTQAHLAQQGRMLPLTVSGRLQRHLGRWADTKHANFLQLGKCELHGRKRPQGPAKPTALPEHTVGRTVSRCLSKHPPTALLMASAGCPTCQLTVKPHSRSTGYSTAPVTGSCQQRCHTPQSTGGCPALVRIST